MDQVFPDLVHCLEHEHVPKESYHGSLRGTYGFVRLSLDFWGKVVRDRFLRSNIPQHFLAPFTAFGIYWPLCRAYNLYWDLHCELTQTEYLPWEIKYRLFAFQFYPRQNLHLLFTQRGL